MVHKNNIIAERPHGLITDTEYYYQQLVYNLPAAIYTCDIDGYVKLYNEAAVKLWGRAPEIGKDLWCGSWKIYNTNGTMMPLSDCPMAVALKEKRPVFGEEIIIERPDGDKRNVLPHPQPIFNSSGEVIGAVNMLIDITENKKSSELNRQLVKFNEELEQFAYAASHDLQEPLRKISTFANLISERNSDQMNESGKLYLSKITQSAERMSGIINDLLSYTRDSRSNQALEVTDLNVIVENVLFDLELIINQKNALIRSDKLPVIKAIPYQMNRLFYNLLNNSLKFSKEGIAPVIEIKCTQTQKEVEIIVTDNGIGFDQVYAEKIFSLFQRLNDRKSYTGSGIGLALCKKIVENYKGSITATSEPDKGASFTIKFPISI